MSEQLKAAGWIKTSERLPEIEVDVLVVSNNGNVCLGFMGLFDDNGLAWVIYEDVLYGWQHTYKPEKYPYWMPLPEPPEVER